MIAPAESSTAFANLCYCLVPTIDAAIRACQAANPQ
jgi:hypothetical protein